MYLNSSYFEQVTGNKEKYTSRTVTCGKFYLLSYFAITDLVTVYDIKLSNLSPLFFLTILLSGK